MWYITDTMGDTWALTVGRSATVVKGPKIVPSQWSNAKIFNPLSKSAEKSLLSHRSKIKEGS